jgi:hypothetical protein
MRTIANEHTFGRIIGKFSLVVRTKVWPTSTTKDSKRIIIGFCVKETSAWLSPLMTLLGSKLIRKVVVRKASSQNLRGMDSLASKASPTSTI